VEHDYCARRVRVVAAVLGCYHTGRLEAERSVERECAIEVGNGEGYYINARFHQSLPGSFEVACRTAGGETQVIQETIH
jgi:hypothetical protein